MEAQPPIAYRLSVAARVLDVDELTLAGLRDDGLIVTYSLGGVEYVTDHALRDLQHRLEVAFAAGGLRAG